MPGQRVYANLTGNGASEGADAPAVGDYPNIPLNM